MRIARSTLVCLILAAAAVSAVHPQAPSAAAKDPNTAFREFARLYFEVHDAARREYGVPVEGRNLVYASIQGLLRNLDPHTSFLSPETYQSMKERQSGTYFGIGCLVGKRNNQITVIAPLDDTPASRAGLRTGDVIVRVDGMETGGMTVNEAVSLIKGPKGSKVELSIFRGAADDAFSVVLERAEIPQETVRYSYMMTPDIGYLRVTEFSQSTADEVKSALDALRQQGMKKLLLDLRSNIGGLFSPAVEVADYFVPEGSVIVDIRGRAGKSAKTYRGSAEYPTWDLPLVVLVNGGTASAGEILSGAIQDNDLGLLVGTRTWGKGLVQTVYNLSYGAGIALTTARYHTPSGRQIQRDYTSYYDYYAHSVPEGEALLTRGEQGESGPQQVFFTAAGRRVLGGGGIRPDVVVELPDLSAFLQYIYSRNIFLNFATRFPVRSGKDLKTLTDQELLEHFSKWLTEDEGLAKDQVEEALSVSANRSRAVNQVRSDFALSQSGSEAAHRVLAQQDVQIQRALQLFGEAAGLLARSK